ncbi:MAG: hypothetical protein HZB51_03560 [Chloroflexi bacterium]|nr:hypothetical protein [Chloroflexota bacterium]
MLNTEQKPLNVIESLVSGFEIIFLHPWALLVPIALDLFLWLGPQISAKPLIENILALLNANVNLLTDNSPDTLQSVEVIRKSLQELANSFNVFGVMSSGVPTLFWVEPPTTEWARTLLYTVNNSWILLALAIPLAMVALVLTVLYFEMIGHAVRGEKSVKVFFVHLLKSLVTTTLLGLLLFVGICLLMFPLSLLAVLVSFLSQGLASFVVLTGMMLMLWAGLYLSFALPAIFVTGSNAPQAILNSISLFRFDFWSTMGLVVVTYLIRWGFTIVWQLFFNTPAGIVFDVIGNAFLGTGLMAAMMVYYADRMKWLNNLRRRIQQHQAQLKGQ